MRLIGVGGMVNILYLTNRPSITDVLGKIIPLEISKEIRVEQHLLS